MMQAASPTVHRRTGLRLFGLFFVCALAGAFAWSVSVYERIAEVGSEDQAASGDAIAVFGAAEYAGRPSPVFHARLDHAADLYLRGTSPVVITLGGGSDKDSGKTEGGVGRDYLLARGVPLKDIIAETTSTDTEQQVHRLAAIARDHDFHHIIVVSDATHMFRIRALCEDAGLDVYTSPRPSLGHISRADMLARYVHEIASYTSYRLGLNRSLLHHWIEGSDGGNAD